MEWGYLWDSDKVFRGQVLFDKIGKNHGSCYIKMIDFNN
jgi:hypothetical protein